MTVSLEGAMIRVAKPFQNAVPVGSAAPTPKPSNKAKGLHQLKPGDILLADIKPHKIKTLIQSSWLNAVPQMVVQPVCQMIIAAIELAAGIKADSQSYTGKTDFHHCFIVLATDNGKITLADSVAPHARAKAWAPEDIESFTNHVVCLSSPDQYRQGLTNITRTKLDQTAKIPYPIYGINYLHGFIRTMFNKNTFPDQVLKQLKSWLKNPNQPEPQFCSHFLADIIVRHLLCRGVKPAVEPEIIMPYELEPWLESLGFEAANIEFSQKESPPFYALWG